MTMEYPHNDARFAAGWCTANPTLCFLVIKMVNLSTDLL